VKANEAAVFRDLQILLGEVCALFDGESISGKSVLWRVSGCSTMRDKQGFARFGPRLGLRGTTPDYDASDRYGQQDNGYHA
jgi:hypothetical protein